MRLGMSGDLDKSCAFGAPFFEGTGLVHWDRNFCWTHVVSCGHIVLLQGLCLGAVLWVEKLRGLTTEDVEVEQGGSTSFACGR